MKKVFVIIKTCCPRASFFESAENNELSGRVWLKFIGAYPFQMVEAALYKYFSDKTNPPQPAPSDILAEIKKLNPAAVDPDAPPPVEDAWAEVQRTMDRHRQPKFSHPAIQATVDCVTYAEITDNPNVEATRAHFFKIYASYSTRYKDEKTALKLTGRSGEPPSSPFRLLVKNVADKFDASGNNRQITDDRKAV